MSGPSLATTLTGKPADTDDTWSIAITGDTVFEESTTPSVGESLQRRLRETALSITNVEATRAEYGEPIAKTGPVNETVAETPAYLDKMGFDAVTLANNHTMDRGPAALRQQLDEFSAAGIDTCGAGESITDALEPLRETVAGQSVEVLNVCEREFGAATATEAGVAWIDHPSTTTRIENAADRADVVVVVAHGGVEYLPLPPPGLQRRLRSFAEAGADLVVGHHPHIPQGWEQHQQTPICYSVGNFRYKRGTRPKTEWGLLLDATFHGDTLTSVMARPVERRGDAVAFVGDRWNPSDFRPYFKESSSIIEDRQTLQTHWQELAVRVFEQRYGPWLRQSAGSDLQEMIRHPLQYFRGNRLWDGDRRQRELLTLLNVVRNESHREVVETAMGVKTGADADRRTPEVRDRVRELLATTEDRAVYDRPSPAAQFGRAAFDHLWRVATDAGARLHPRRVTERL